MNAPVGPEKSGSLDLLRHGIFTSENGDVILTLKTNPHSKDQTQSKVEKIENSFNVVIMNPPFTRSDRIPALVGDRARNDLNRLGLTFGRIRTNNLFVAGLGKPFLVLAGRLCGEDGRIALVLPNSILSRDGWKDIRRGIVNSYAIEYIIASFAKGVPNFSSDTQFREILLVLRKSKKENERIRTNVINLFAPIDDLKLNEVDSLAYSIKSGRESIVIPRKTHQLVATSKRFDWNRIVKLSDNWYRLVAFKNLELTEHHLSLIEKHCTKLKSYFAIGSVVDHSNGFEVLRNQPPNDHYCAVWGSGKRPEVTTLRAKPHQFIVITNRHDIKCRLWGKEYSSRLMILRRGQLDTQYALIFELDKEAVSNVWWPLHTLKNIEEEYTKAIVVFLNSIFGIIHMLGERLETRGLWIEYKKGQLTKFPIPDFRKIGLKALRSIFVENGVEESMVAPMPSVRDYIATMASIEAKSGDFGTTIEEALRNPEVRARASIDKVSMQLLDLLGCKTVPQKIYQLVQEEMETLRHIMENDTNQRAIKDRGSEALKGINDKYQRKIAEFS